MAIETQPLLQTTPGSKKGAGGFFKKAFKCFYLGQWPALLILMWNFMISFFTSLPFSFNNQVSDPEEKERVDIMYLSVYGAVLLFYPFFGWIADTFIKRYTVIGTSMYLVLTGTVMGIALSVTAVFEEEWLTQIVCWILVALTICIALLGNGLFKANAIQFGSSQMLDASSWQLSGFIHWYYWTTRLGNVLVYYMILALKFAPTIKSNSYIQSLSYILLVVIIAQLLLTIISIVTFHASKRHLNIEPPKHNPIKTVAQVLKYSFQHKYPQNRSAFTYWEQDMPTCLDLGKNRYGGPFTTEEVEDTKTFLRILLILISLLGIRAVKSNTQNVASEIILNIGNSSLTNSTTRYITYLIIGADADHLTSLTVLLVIPFSQVILKPLLDNYYPNMLKKFWIGLLFAVLSSTAILAIVVSINNTQLLNNTHINETDINKLDIYLTLLCIPQVLNGFVYILVFLTALEFILAQAPHTMQGLLIGLWYMLDVIDSVLQGLDFVYKLNEVVYSTRLGIALVSLLMYSVIVYFYKYRDRDDIVNSYLLVTDKVERNIANRIYNEQSSSGTDLIIVSNSEYSINSTTTNGELSDVHQNNIITWSDD